MKSSDSVRNEARGMLPRGFRPPIVFATLPAQKRTRKVPSQLALDDLNASLVSAFLEDLKSRRQNSARSRNLRLTTIRSFFRYASLEAPAHSRIIQQVLAIPNQRQR